MEIFDRLASIVKSRENNGFILNIGVIKEVLEPCTKLKYNWAGGGLRVDSYGTYSWIKRRGNLAIRPELEPNPHMIIVGMSGYGKSTLLRGIINDVKIGNRPAIVFDAHNEHESVVSSVGGRVYDAEYTGLNIFELDGVSIDQRISDITSLFTEVYGLGHVQASKLSSCIWCTYRKLGARSRTDKSAARVPTIADLLGELYIFLRNAKTTTERNTITHLIGRISLLNGVGSSKETVSMSELKSGISSFSLSGLKNPEAQIIYISELLRRLYIRMKENKKERGLSLYIILDEAQFLIDSSEAGGNFVAKLISEGRKYGVGVIVVTHMASTLNKRVVANASTFVTFYSREPSEINYVANLFAGGDQARAYIVKGRLSRLRQGEAMVLSGKERRTMIATTKTFRDFEGIKQIESPRLGKILEDARHALPYRELLEMHSGNEGGISELIKKGELASFEDPKVNLWVMKRNGSLSIEHEVYVRLISRRLGDLGIENRIVDNANGPDILAYVGGKRVAIEYETGRKSVADTAGMLKRRRLAYQTVIVFVNSLAYRFYKDYFELPGLYVFDISGLYSFRFPEGSSKA